MIGFASLENTFGLGMLPLATRLAAAESGRMSDSFPAHTCLKSLFEGLAVESFSGEEKKRVTCIITDSRRVVPGALFFAFKGLRTDGNQYIDEAIERGAVAIVSEVAAKVPAHVSYIHVAHVRETLAHVSRRFYQSPDEALEIAGITGTNGKTTVAMMTQHLFSKAAQQKAGLLGTIHYDLGSRTLPSYKTTPESVDIYGMLQQMKEAGCERAVMEVSSHGAEQSRVHGLRIPLMAFLNLTQDHMDYHETMESYFEAKAQLFTGATGNTPQVAVINIDDAYGRKLLERIPETTQVITFGLSSDAMVRAEAIELGANGSTFNLVWPDGKARIATKELGSYNVSNILAALSIGIGAGLDIAPLLEPFTSFPGVPGRMERIEEGQPFNVLVDYAHTDDALRNALTMLKDITTERLLVVFGCGGNRDRDKRSLMTAAVQSLADESWATSDNPRKETVEAIFEDMQSGVSQPDQIHFVGDRRRAISLALDAARPGDCVLIAGKGHETFQEFADTVVPFDDRLVARELLAIKEFRT